MDPARGWKSSMRSPRSPCCNGTICSPACAAILLFKLGRIEDACAEFERAAMLAQNSRDKKLLLERAAACDLRTI
jgi:predicted RNA polymerase sigma factor